MAWNHTQLNCVDAHIPELCGMKLEPVVLRLKVAKAIKPHTVAFVQNLAHHNVAPFRLLMDLRKSSQLAFLHLHSALTAVDDHALAELLEPGITTLGIKRAKRIENDRPGNRPQPATDRPSA